MSRSFIRLPAVLTLLILLLSSAGFAGESAGLPDMAAFGPAPTNEVGPAFSAPLESDTDILSDAATQGELDEGAVPNDDPPELDLYGDFELPVIGDVDLQLTQAITDIAFPCQSIDIGLRESVKVAPVIIGGDLVELRWKSSNSDVAEVDQEGRITGKKRGKARITVLTQNQLRASLIVKVRKAPRRVELPRKKRININETVQLEAILPAGTASCECQWESSDPRVATVDSNGLVMGLNAGVATITVTTFNDRQATCKVTVLSPVVLPEPLLIAQDVSDYDLSHLRDVGPRSDFARQDIALYNGILFQFAAGLMEVSGVTYPITNGHGNNCMFGVELHGAYPYLYCGSWIRDDCHVYINQLSAEGASLVKTISYPDLQGYLNCCVDEPEQRIYILLNTSEKTRTGIVDFIVSDFEGNILSRRSFGKLPVIQGMTFHKGLIYVLSGFGYDKYPNCLSVLNTSGELVAFSYEPGVIGENEGIDFDGDSIVIASTYRLYR